MMNMKMLCLVPILVLASSLTAGGVSPVPCGQNIRPKDEKGNEKQTAVELMTMRANGIKVKFFAVKPPMRLKDAMAELQKSAPGLPIRVKPLKDGTTPVVPQTKVGDASVYEIATILCVTVDYSVRITPQGILAEPN